MTINQHTEPRQESALRSGARQLLGNRFGLLAVAVLVLGLGAYSSWGWLVAARAECQNKPSINERNLFGLPVDTQEIKVAF